jgi:hypothetical protein
VLAYTGYPQDWLRVYIWTDFDDPNRADYVSRTALPKLLGDGNHKGRVKGFTIPGMRQRQHFCKPTNKGKNKLLVNARGFLVGWSAIAFPEFWDY